ncbi:MAG: efflux RND transporter periplasmic adaptor subunit [Candidatus Delongbacteria bacterium]|nr:efflux RND transporter periplasmic adaptor subunit [Candidatus Delongbacteria bacterium]
MKKKSKKKKFIWLIIVLIIVAVIIKIATKEKEFTTIESEKVKKRVIVKTISASGVVEPIKTVNISSEIAANIKRLLVKEGDIVIKGDLLVELDRKTIEAEVAQQKAALAQQKYNSQMAMSRLKQAKIDYENKVKLKKNNFLSDTDFENVKLNLEIAKTSYESSLESIKLQQAYLEQSKDKLNKTNFYAPMDGLVSKIYKEEGEMVLGSQFNTDVVLNIVNIQELQVNIEVDENDVALISINDSVKVTIDALPDTVFKGLVTEIGNSPAFLGSAERSVAYKVMVKMLTKDSRIKPGMTSYTEIVTDVVNDVLSIPIQALARRKKSELNKSDDDEETVEDEEIEEKGIVWSNESEYADVVFKLTSNGSGNIYTVETAQVKTGIANNRFIEITDGLEEDDLIVIGNYKTISKVLKDEMEVKDTSNKGE